MKKQILIIGILALLSLMIAGCNSGATENTADSGGYVKIPLSDLSNKVRFYTFEDNGVEINYFAVLGSDGKPRTAFDACDVCGGYKGYRQTGKDITCNNCGRVFNIDDLGTENKGYGCWPSYLPHQIQGDNILIKTGDIRKGRHRFA